MQTGEYTGRRIDYLSLKWFNLGDRAWTHYKGCPVHFSDLPGDIIQKYRQEMKGMQNTLRFLKLNKIADDNERLEQFILKVYGRRAESVCKTNVTLMFGKAARKLWDNSDLSFREKEVIKHVLEGLSDKEIAGQMLLSPGEVAQLKLKTSNIVKIMVSLKEPPIPKAVRRPELKSVAC